jgi:alpha-amylase
VELDRAAGKISLIRRGHLWRPLNVAPVTIEKQFTLVPDSDQIEIRYLLSMRSEESVTATFAIENNFSFQAGHAEDRTILIDKVQNINSYLDSTGRHEQKRSWAMTDQYRSLVIALDSDQECEMWHAPIFTVSLSEAGFEKVYQGTTFMNIYRLQLSEQPTEINLTLFAGDLKRYKINLNSMSTAGSS